MSASRCRRLLRLAVAGAVSVLLLPEALSARDRGADGRFDRRESSHFVLLQDVDIDRRSGWRGSVRFEREVLAVLERAYDSLDALLGLRPERRLEVRVYDPARFDARYAPRFRFPVAGFYGGVIHVRGDTLVTRPLVRTLNHELVHAALDAAAPSLSLPLWLNEGVAEWFERRSDGQRHPSRREWAYLRGAHERGEWLPIATLSAPSLAGFPPDAAGLAYLQSYALVDHLARRGGERKLARWLADLPRARDPERSLARVYGLGSLELERQLRAELR